MKVGDWVAPCCLNDLQQIQNSQDLAAFLEDEFLTSYRVWSTCPEAVAELIEEVDPVERANLLSWHLNANTIVAKEIARYLGDP